MSLRPTPINAPRGAVLLCAEVVICSAWAVSPGHLHAPSRGKSRIAVARQALAYIARVELGVPMADIGAYLARDGSTIAHACRVTEDRRDSRAFDRALAALGVATVDLAALALGER